MEVICRKLQLGASKRSTCPNVRVWDVTGLRGFEECRTHIRWTNRVKHARMPIKHDGLFHGFEMKTSTGPAAHVQLVQLRKATRSASFREWPACAVWLFVIAVHVSVPLDIISGVPLIFVICRKFISLLPFILRRRIFDEYCLYRAVLQNFTFRPSKTFHSNDLEKEELELEIAPILTLKKKEIRAIYKQI